MRHTKNIYLLLAPVLAASVAFAQTSAAQAADNAPTEDAIAAARSQYTTPAAISTDANDGKMLAQLQPAPRPRHSSSTAAWISRRKLSNTMDGSWQPQPHSDRSGDRVRCWSGPRREPERSQRHPSQRRNTHRGRPLRLPRRMCRAGCLDVPWRPLFVCTSQKPFPSHLA